MSHSQRSVTSERNPPSQRSYHDRPRRERYGPNGQPNGERRDQRSHNRLPSRAPVRGQHSRPPTVISERYSRHSKASSLQHSPPAHRSNPEKQTFSEKCSNLCSIRGVLQFVEITVGILVLICVVASYAVLSGYTSAAGFGSFSIDSAYSPFEGTEMQQVRDVDLQYSQLRAPGVYGGVAFSLSFCALTSVFLILGAKPIHRVSTKLLFAELIFDVVGCLGYIIAVGLYLHFIKTVNATDTCKTRERLYAGRGYTWMNCEVQGGDAAVAIFGLIAACVYLPSAILCALYIRTVRDFRKNYLSHEPASYNDNQEGLHKSREEHLNFLPSTLV
ncbi:MARVEL domain-containing protein 3-like isoform X2 [Bufo gargarizans]|uniref:MARVEL domain-containing protein 3-like isoform X2 n=1 Tax=Bufo gargarizans TaxID=30331 RepID=UPI001CF0D6A7|nr:MARVEL domain-containing protein 3-like isoform X2 [Bufo gargarizans]